MINKIIGNYKITKLLGEGGMASVYEAEHKLLGTKVAIKVLNPTLSSNAQIKERFINEAKMMASLEHPNITRVIDFDDQPQQLSIVMEFLKGEDLNQKIKRQGALKEAEIVNVFTQTLSAFQYAHEQGIVHRDIKPSNIFILPDGTVKILDFGIAKLFGQSNEMTQTGTQMGTPIYMSPEQVKADKTIDFRSDIYSLGVTLYYALNGKPPYDSNTSSQFDIFNKIVYEPLTLLGNHNRFDALIVKACAKDREQRFQNCSEWIKELSSSERQIDLEKTQVESATLSSAPTLESGVKDEENVKTVIQSKNDSNPTPSPEKLTNTTTPKEKNKNLGRPIFLAALCVLNWLELGALIIISTFNLIEIGRFSGEYYYLGTFNHILQQNLIALVSNLLCVIGTVLMWKMRKIGFFIYLIGALIELTTINSVMLFYITIAFVIMNSLIFRRFNVRFK